MYGGPPGRGQGVAQDELMEKLNRRSQVLSARGGTPLNQPVQPVPGRQQRPGSVNFGGSPLAQHQIPLPGRQQRPGSVNFGESPLANQQQQFPPPGRSNPPPQQQPQMQPQRPPQQFPPSTGQRRPQPPPKAATIQPLFQIPRSQAVPNPQPMDDELPPPPPEEDSFPPPIDAELPPAPPESDGSVQFANCDRCEGPSTVSCAECDIFLCDACDQDVHSRGKWIAHVRFPVQELEGQDQKQPISKTRSQVHGFAIPLPGGATPQPLQKPQQETPLGQSKVNRSMVIPLPGATSTPLPPPASIAPANAAPAQEVRSPLLSASSNRKVNANMNMEIPLPKPSGGPPAQTPVPQSPVLGQHQPPLQQHQPQRGAPSKGIGQKAAILQSGNIPLGGMAMPAPSKNKQLSDSAWMDILTTFEAEWTWQKLKDCNSPDDLHRASNHLQQLLNVKGLEKRLKGLEKQRTAGIFTCLAVCLAKQ